MFGGEGDGILTITGEPAFHLGNKKVNHTSNVFITLLPRTVKLERKWSVGSEIMKKMLWKVPVS